MDNSTCCSHYYFRVCILRNALTKRLESGGSVRIGPVEVGELREEIASVRKGLSEINAKISGLFLATMSPAMYLNLKKLQQGNFGPYQKSKALERELHHLRNIGYVDIGAISMIPETGNLYYAYVKVTETGNSFVELRDMVENERSNATHVTSADA
jgi:hypothetical protein